MQKAVMDKIGEQDIFIACAAVADYRPANIAKNKIKKEAETLSIELLRNPDILANEIIDNLESGLNSFREIMEVINKDEKK